MGVGFTCRFIVVCIGWRVDGIMEWREREIREVGGEKKKEGRKDIELLCISCAYVNIWDKGRHR